MLERCRTFMRQSRFSQRATRSTYQNATRDSEEMSRAVFPASFAQERLWFLDQFEPGTAAYNLPRVFRIIGPLNAGVLTRAIHGVVQRHASLRTVFDSLDGEARQVVLPN